MTSKNTEYWKHSHIYLQGVKELRLIGGDGDEIQGWPKDTKAKECDISCAILIIHIIRPSFDKLSKVVTPPPWRHLTPGVTTWPRGTTVIDKKTDNPKPARGHHSNNSGIRSGQVVRVIAGEARSAIAEAFLSQSYLGRRVRKQHKLPLRRARSSRGRWMVHGDTIRYETKRYDTAR